MGKVGKNEYVSLKILRYPHMPLMNLIQMLRKLPFTGPVDNGHLGL